MCGTALVTGASGGIGREIALELAARGFRVVVVARREKLLHDLCRVIHQRSDGDARAIVSDLAEPGSPGNVCDALERDGLSIDVLVNNAGVGYYGRFHEAEWSSQSHLVHLNVLALTELTHRLLPHMVQRGSGHVLNIASTASFKPGPLTSVYNATKAYVLSFTEALAEELGGTGVTATAVCPGATHSGFAEAAGLDRSQLPSYKPIPSASSVAAFAVDAMDRGRPVAIHGIANQAITAAQRLVPRRWVSIASRKVREKRS